MKRTIAILLVLLLAGGAVFAQDRIDTATPKDARSMAMGGAFVAMSEGYQSLLGNPAAFADKKAELTLATLNPWVYVSPTQANIDTFQEVAESMSDDPAAVAGPLSDLVTTNGFGAGVSTGFGWVGKGLGLGLVGSGEAYIRGKTLLGAEGTLDGQVAAVVGIGIPLNLGPFKVQVGGDIRPYLRMTGDIVGTDLLGAMMGGEGEDEGEGEGFPMSLPVDVGFGLAVDLGAKIELGSLVSVGLAVRDISTKQTYASSTLGEVISGGGLPEGDDVSYKVLPNITVGASVTPIPTFLRKLIDVTVTAEIQDPVKVVQDNASIWNLFHVGAEADLLGGLLALRTGVNKGYISVGAGLDLLIMEVNVAVFTEELGARPGDMPRSGVSAEVALRF